MKLTLAALSLLAIIALTQFEEVNGSRIDRCGGLCKNNGRCVYSHYSRKHFCKCTRDFFGKFCQTRRNRCRPGICKNGGYCVCRKNVISCRCRAGFTGKNCEKQLEATCILTQSSTVSGTINIKQFRNGVRITGQVKGIPAGKHGFHVHQYGDLSNGCASFGGHFNPFGLTHGAPTDQIRHVGDLGNIVANSNDISNINIFDRQVSLVGKFNVFGRGLVIHAGVDDLGRGGDAGSLATGNAGSRLACCIIVHKA